jgi:myo-inositol-1(or 4)-monophosphatase
VLFVFTNFAKTLLLMDFEKLCKQTITVAVDAGQYILNERKSFSNAKIEMKGIHDFVTYVDRASENMIIDRLSNILPGSTFLAEESYNENTESECMWIIDPLDGTTNFIHGLPLFTVSIALLFNRELVLGVIYEPNLNECYYAWKNGGARLNDAEIRISQTNEMTNSLLATGFPYYDYQHLDSYIEFLKFTIEKTRGLRRLGSAALDLAWVACGRFEGFYEYGLRPWDVAAGACIVSEAGGKVTDFMQSNNYLFGREVIATNGKIHDELCREIQEFFFKGKKIQ